MKKSISLILTFCLLFNFVIAEEIEAEVDVIVDTPQKVQNQERLKIMEKRIAKLKFTEEQKQKLMKKIQETFETSDVPKTLLCVELCKNIENEWSKKTDLNYCLQDMERIQNRIRTQIKNAKDEIKQIQVQHRERNQQAIETLENLIEIGVPVENALQAVKEAMVKNEANIREKVNLKLQEQLNKEKISLPEELKEQIRAQIRTQTQLRQETQTQQKIGEDKQRGEKKKK